MSKLTPKELRRFPLPDPNDACDKDSRGRGLIIGSSFEVPGAALLSGEAFLRAGAGKVQLAIPRELAATIGVAFPECGIIPYCDLQQLPNSIFKAVDAAGCTLVGPGLTDRDGTKSLVDALFQSSHEGTIVLDAMALHDIWARRAEIRKSGNSTVLTPHHGEMAAMLGINKEKVAAAPLNYAVTVAEELGSVVVLKASTTHIVDSNGRSWTHSDGCIGLATSGSGDVLAGLLAGLVARGCSPVGAALWAVSAHAKAGRIMTDYVGDVGFLARELIPFLPEALARLAGPAD